jgi:hypothetical protein
VPSWAVQPSGPAAAPGPAPFVGRENGHTATADAHPSRPNGAEAGPGDPASQPRHQGNGDHPGGGQTAGAGRSGAACAGDSDYDAAGEYPGDREVAGADAAGAEAEPPAPAFHRLWSSPTPPGEDDQE